MSTDQTRHSQAGEAELVTDPDELAQLEGLNGIRQFDAVVGMVESFLSPDRPFKFRPSHLLHLHREALRGITRYAGTWRPADIEIGGSKHRPVGAHQVPEMIEDMCDYVNSSWAEKTAIHLSAYVMWRLNWIHPFTDGKWANIPSGFVSRSMRKNRVPASRQANDSGPNLTRAQSLLSSAGSRRPKLSDDWLGGFERNGNVIVIASGPTAPAGHERRGR